MKHIRAAALKLHRATRGMKSDSGSGAHLWHKGIYVAVNQSAPPPVDKYDEWLAEHLKQARKWKITISGSRLRRAVVMTRNGSTCREIGSAIGMSGACISGWLAKLPPELAA